MTLYAILVISLAVWVWGLWRRGFFGSQTPAIERKLYLLRIALWFASILIVSVPLRQHRDSLGSVVYIGSAFVILGLFYWLGVALSRAIMKRHLANGP